MSRRWRDVYTEMEFWDITVTKDSSLLLHAIPRPFYWQILKKTILYPGLKIHTKKSAKQENSSLFMNSILLDRKNEGRKLKLESSRRLKFMPRNLD